VRIKYLAEAGRKRFRRFLPRLEPYPENDEEDKQPVGVEMGSDSYPLKKELSGFMRVNLENTGRKKACR